MKLVNDEKKKALSAQQFSLAYTLNASLLQSYSVDVKVKTIGTNIQALTQIQLEKDGKHIAGQASAAGEDLSPSTAKTLQLSPAAAPIQ